MISQVMQERNREIEENQIILTKNLESAEDKIREQEAILESGESQQAQMLDEYAQSEYKL